MAGEEFEILERNVSADANSSILLVAMETGEIAHFKTTIVKKIRYFLYTMWYAKPARKVYQKCKFKKDDFIWYTREGLEKSVRADANATLQLSEPKPALGTPTSNRTRDTNSVKSGSAQGSR